MVIADVIKDKDYDYIAYRTKLPKHAGGGEAFIGCAKSKDGKLISLDGDTYTEDEKIISFEEWTRPERNIINGLTVVV